MKHLIDKRLTLKQNTANIKYWALKMHSNNLNLYEYPSWSLLNGIKIMLDKAKPIKIEKIFIFTW